MSSNHPSPDARVVLVAALESAVDIDNVVLTAANLAQTIAGAELHLVHTIGDDGPTVTGFGVPVLLSGTEILEEGRKLMDTAAKRVRERFAGRVAVHLAIGEPWRQILQLAQNLQADIIVVGTHGRKGLDRLMAGSVAERVVRRAQCPVVVARAKDYHTRDVPEIEPACADCLALQRETVGAKLCCARHEKPQHPHGHVHYELPQPFAVGSMFIRET